MNDSEFSVVPNLTQLPLFVSIEVVIEGFLLKGFKFLELKNLSEQILVWQYPLLVMVEGLLFLLLLFVVEQGILSILREIKKF